jgi:hypothetical protein
MDTMITKERKDEIILSLRKFIVDNDDKVALYDEIYHHVEELVPRRVPRGEVLREKEDVLRFIRYQRHKQEVKKKNNEKLLAVVQALPTTSDNHEEGDEDLRGRHHMSGEEILQLYNTSQKPAKRQRDNESNT